MTWDAEPVGESLEQVQGNDMAQAALELAHVRLRHADQLADVALARARPPPEDADNRPHVAVCPRPRHLWPGPEVRRRGRWLAPSRGHPSSPAVWAAPLGDPR